MEKAVELVLLILTVYLLGGFLFAIPFVWKGVTRIDPDGAKGTRWGFRLIIFPGTMVFWPVLLAKWIKAHNKNE